MLLIAASFMKKNFSGADIKRGKAIFKRDRFNRLSPNSAQTESFVAGLLGIQLGGTHFYFGKPIFKQTIGDELKATSVSDARKAIHLIFPTELVFVCLAGAVLLCLAIIFLNIA